MIGWAVTRMGISFWTNNAWRVVGFVQLPRYDVNKFLRIAVDTHPHVSITNSQATYLS